MNDSDQPEAGVGRGISKTASGRVQEVGLIRFYGQRWLGPDMR